MTEQSIVIEQLVDKADAQGYLTLNQIADVFPEAEKNLGQVEDLFFELCERDIGVYDTQCEAQRAIALDKAQGAGDKPLAHHAKEDEERPDISRVGTDDPVGLYFNRIGQVPLLTHEEEVQLAKQLERGLEAQRHLNDNGHDDREQEELKHLIQQGERARHHLIEANTRLVVSVAKKYMGLGVPFLDLIQAGNVGLIKATDKFDYRRGHKFSTYATWWIRQSVTRTLTQQERTIRIPVHMSDHIRKVYKIAQRLEQRLGRRPTPEEIAEEARMEPEKVRWMLRVSRRPLSLDKPLGEEADSSVLGDLIEDQKTLSPVQGTEQRLLREDLEGMMTTLTHRESCVLRLRFGLRGDRQHTLKEVGEKLGVTRERVRQIERKALRKLRHPRYARKLQSYLR